MNLAASTLSRLLDPLRINPFLWELGNRYGRSFWRLPSVLRKAIHWESSAARLGDARTWSCGPGEPFNQLSLGSLRKPSMGYRLAARGFSKKAPSVTVLKSAWLVGRFASPVTHDKRLIPSAFRDEPRVLGLERHPDLETWLEQSTKSGPLESEWEHVWPMVNRLQTNYFHWLVEWCGRLEVIEKYREMTGRSPRLLIPEGGPSFIRESLRLLGFDDRQWLTWNEGNSAVPVKDLVLPSFRGSTVAPSLAGMLWLRRRLMAAADATWMEPEQVIYLSRPVGGWRCVQNDEEVAAWFHAQGYEVLVPHDWPLDEQIRRFAKARLIVGLHGAGLTNMIFAPGASVVELTGAYGDGLYFGMAGRLKQPHTTLKCQPVGDDVTVNLESLRGIVRASLRDADKMEREAA